MLAAHARHRLIDKQPSRPIAELFPNSPSADVPPTARSPPMTERFKTKPWIVHDFVSGTVSFEPVAPRVAQSWFHPSDGNGGVTLACLWMPDHHLIGARRMFLEPERTPAHPSPHNTDCSRPWPSFFHVRVGSHFMCRRSDDPCSSKWANQRFSRRMIMDCAHAAALMLMIQNQRGIEQHCAPYSGEVS